MYNCTKINELDSTAQVGWFATHNVGWDQIFRSKKVQPVCEESEKDQAQSICVASDSTTRFL